MEYPVSKKQEVNRLMRANGRMKNNNAFNKEDTKKTNITMGNINEDRQND